MKKFVTTMLSIVALMLIAVPAFAQDGATFASGLVAIGAAMAISIAALGGTMGQGRAAASALEGIARNPQAAPRVQTPMIIALAMIESLVLFSLVIAFIISGKI